MNLRAPISLSRPVRAALEFRDVGGGTHLIRQHTPHPFHITRPFRHPGDPQGMATLYLQSSSGGIYGGDDLGLTIRVDAGAAAYVTSQASTIVQDARGAGAAHHDVTLEVGAGGWLEYLPDPAILMSGSQLVNRVFARIENRARLLMADAQMCHDPDGDGRPFDSLDSCISITGPEGPRLVDRFTLEGADWLARTGGARCSGMIVAVGAEPSGAAMLGALETLDGVYAGLSEFPERDVSIVRFLADDGVSLSRALTVSWQTARLALTGAEPHARRK